MSESEQKLIEAACAFIDKEREEGQVSDLGNQPGVFVDLVKAVEHYRASAFREPRR